MSEPDTIANTSYRFSDVMREPCEMLSPIEGFARVRVETIEDAIKPLIEIVPGIQKRLPTVKAKTTNPLDGLTQHESAAIALYTLEWAPHFYSVFFILNTDLRDKNRPALKPWFPYLKLLITGLNRLPQLESRREVYRGVNLEQLSDVEKYQVGEEIVWWGFSSCSVSKTVSLKEQFIGNRDYRVLFIIDIFSGKDIQKHSYYDREKEVLLLPATTVKVVSRQQQDDGTFVIRLKEIQSHPGLLESIGTSPQKQTLVKRLLKTIKGPTPIPAAQPPASPRTEIRRRPNHDTALYESLARYKPETPATLAGKLYGDFAMQIVVDQLIIAKKCPILILRDNHLTHRGAKLLASVLCSNQTLLELYSVENDLGVEGVKALCEALSNATNTNLKKLCLVASGIGDEGVHYIASMLEKNKTLSELHLPQNKIGDQGFQELMEVLTTGNQTLRLLSLEWNKFGDAGSFQALKNMLRTNKTLTSLNVESCKLTNAHTQLLRALCKTKDNFKLLIS